MKHNNLQTGYLWGPWYTFLQLHGHGWVVSDEIITEAAHLTIVYAKLSCVSSMPVCILAAMSVLNKAAQDPSRQSLMLAIPELLDALTYATANDFSILAGSLSAASSAASARTSSSPA